MFTSILLILFRFEEEVSKKISAIPSMSPGAITFIPSINENETVATEDPVLGQR